MLEQIDYGYVRKASVRGTVGFVSATYSIDEDSGPVTPAVQRTGGSDGPVTAYWRTVDGTAVAGTDYTASSGTLTWADGNSDTQEISIPIIGNAVVDGDRNFTVELYQIDGADTGTTPTTITITDNDVSLVDMPLMALYDSSQNTQVRLWNATTWAEQTPIDLPSGYIGANDVAFSPDGTKLAIASNQGVSVFDLASQTTTASPVTTTSAVKVKWSPDGTKIAAAMNSSSGERVAILSATDLSLVASLKTQLPSAGFLAVAWKPDGSVLACGTYTSHYVYAFETTNWTALAAVHNRDNFGGVYALEWVAANKLFVGGTWDPSQFGLNTTNSSPTSWTDITITNALNIGSQAKDIALSSDGLHGVTAHADQTPVCGFDFTNATWVQEAAVDSGFFTANASRIGLHPDGTRFFATESVNSPYLTVLDASDRQTLLTPPVSPGGSTWAIAFKP